jgi:hypothetical protein
MDVALIAAELERAFRENPAASPDGEDILSEGILARTHYFRSLTITVGKIKEMEENGYFMKDEAHAHGAETVPEPNDNKATLYKFFFITSLRMPPHPVVANILLHF